MHRHLRPLALVTLAVVILAACGSDASGKELSSEEQAYADAFAKDLADEDDGIGVSGDEADCMATAIMAELGVGPFEKADVDPEDLAGDDTPGQLLGEGAITKAEATAIFEAWNDCADIAAAFAAGAKDQFDADADSVGCLEAGLRKGNTLRDYMVASFTSGDEPDPSKPPLADLISLVVDCTSDSETGAGGALVDSIAESLAAGSELTAEQARCMAQSIVDIVGTEALIAGGASGDFSGASPELQQQVVAAVTTAAESCDVPIDKLGG